MSDHHPLTHRALAKLSRAVYEKFGEEALPLVTEAWHEMGIKAGKRIQSKKGISTFREAADDHVQMVLGFGDVYDFCTVTDRVYHARTRPGTPCDVGLENAGAPACHACMAVNKSQLETICGAPVDMEVPRSRAMGDDCCEVKYILRATG
jgi:predicted hydrocarbon binding protein